MTLFLWLFYILGQFFSMWKRANLSAKSQFSPFDNVKQYVVGHAPQMGINFLLCSGLFWTVWHDTSFLTKVLAYFGFQKDIEVPLNPFTAAIYGVFSDSVMDFIVAKISTRVPQLQVTVPPTGANDAPKP